MKELGRIKGNGDAVDMYWQLQGMLASEILKSAKVDACDVNVHTYIYTDKQGDGVVVSKPEHNAYPTDEFRMWGYVDYTGDVRHALWTNELIA